jgi:hypothetical protein
MKRTQIYSNSIITNKPFRQSIPYLWLAGVVVLAINFYLINQAW